MDTLPMMMINMTKTIIPSMSIICTNKQKKTNESLLLINKVLTV